MDRLLVAIFLLFALIILFSCILFLIGELSRFSFFFLFCFSVIVMTFASYIRAASTKT